MNQQPIQLRERTFTMSASTSPTRRSWQYYYRFVTNRTAYFSGLFMIEIPDAIKEDSSPLWNVSRYSFGSKKELRC